MKTRYRILKQEDAIKKPYYYIEKKRILWTPLKDFVAKQETNPMYYTVAFDTLLFSTEDKALSFIESLKSRKRIKSPILRAKLHLENSYVYFLEDEVDIFKPTKSIKGYAKSVMITDLKERLKTKIIKEIKI